ncbi:aldehyde dehydrogenase family protein, partial [Rhodococcus sp. WS4]
MDKLLINGKLVDGAQALAVVDPATGEAFATCARADLQQLESAIGAAKFAQRSWVDAGYPHRRAALDRLADAMQDDFDALRTLLTREQGKPLAQAGAEIGSAIATLRFYSEQQLRPLTLRENDNEKIVESRYPLGVVAAITPWNYPISLLVTKLAPALIAGNTVVAKPAPTTPLTTLRLAALARECVPPGVLNVIVDDNDLGAPLSRHPDVAKVSFTGSTATGARVMGAAAESIKRITLELGGNDAAIILDDADLETTVPAIFRAATINAGQVCLAAKRVYAPRRMYDEVCSALADLAASAVVGSGLDSDTEIGPVQNRSQFDRLTEIIEDAARCGTVLTPRRAVPSSGYFVAPTVIRDLPDSARLVREEQFGPLIPVLAYDSLDEVVSRTNDSEFGLGGSVWSSDTERAVAVAERIESGTVWVNRHLNMPIDVPMGGAKQSGLGRERGIAGLEEFSQTKITRLSRLRGGCGAGQLEVAVIVKVGLCWANTGKSCRNKGSAEFG